MTTIVDVFVGNETLIDEEIYQFWLDGHTVESAAKVQQKRGTMQQFGATFEMLISEVDDQFRIFRMLEQHLKNPKQLSYQLELQVDPDGQKMFIEKYYEFDSVLVRELLGKKLNTRHRNSLEELSEKTRVSLRSCRRQFDNIKRVFKMVEDLPGSTIDIITNHFQLNPSLSQKYAAIVFFSNNRFDLSKKKLFYLSFPDIVNCANALMQYWSYAGSNKENKDNGELTDIDIDRDFLQETKELKIFSDKENLEYHKRLTLESLSQNISPNLILSVDKQFKNISKVIIGIGCNLNNSRDLKDLFSDLLEKLIVPFKSFDWTKENVHIFMIAYQNTAIQISSIIKNSKYNQLKILWERFVTPLVICIQCMYIQ